MLNSNLFIVLILGVVSIISSCDNTFGCGGPADTYQEYTRIHLTDTSNQFVEIYYPEFNVHIKKGDLHLYNNEYKWDLRYSKPVTTLYIQTIKRGWDTLTYSIVRNKLKYETDNTCEEDVITSGINRPDIVHHSFDSIYYTYKRDDYFSNIAYITLYIQ